MNVMLLLAQVAPALTDSIAGANPVLTPVAGPEEMNLWSMAVKGGWIMIVLGLLSILCFYILFERNYVIRKAGKEDPMFMDKIKDYILDGEIKAAIAYCRSVNTPAARMIEKGISRLGRPVNDVQAAIENVGNIEVAKLEKGLTIMATISGRCADDWFPRYGDRYGACFLRNGQCRQQHRYHIAFGRYLRSYDHYGRWLDRGYYCDVCL